MQVFSFEIETKERWEVDVNVGGGEEYLVVGVYWRDSESFYVRRMDRFQSENVLLKVSLGVKEVKVISSEKKESGWFELSVLRKLIFIESGSSFLQLKQNNNYFQLAVIDSESGNVLRWLTSANGPVSHIFAYIPSTQLM